MGLSSAHQRQEGTFTREDAGVAGNWHRPHSGDPIMSIVYWPVQSVEQADRTAGDRCDIDPLLPQQPRSGKAAHKPDTYGSDYIWLHRFNPLIRRKCGTPNLTDLA